MSDLEQVMERYHASLDEIAKGNPELAKEVFSIATM